MKILLLRPATKGYAVPPPDIPTGLLYLSSRLKQVGYDVVFKDLEFEQLCDVSEYDVCGVSILSKCRQSAFDVIRKVRELKPSIRIIVGGPHVSSYPEQVLNNLPVDSVVVGEGEDAIMLALWKDGVKELPLISHLDEVSFPDYEQVDFSRYYMQIARAHPNWIVNGVEIGKAKYCAMIASRGCVGKCSFCGAWAHWGLKLRFRSAQNIVDEMELLNKKYGVSLISFNDNAFGGNKKIVIEMCNEILKRNLKIAWKVDTRPDFIDEEMAVAMRAAGCFVIAVGVESGSPKILKSIHKKYNLDKARERLLAIKKAGIVCYVLLMVGNPGESVETISETVAYLSDIRPNIVTWVEGVMVLPGTEMDILNCTELDFWLSGKDLPVYLRERSVTELRHFSGMLSKIEKDSFPQFKEE